MPSGPACLRPLAFSKTGPLRAPSCCFRKQFGAPSCLQKRTHLWHASKIARRSLIPEPNSVGATCLQYGGFGWRSLHSVMTMRPPPKVVLEDVDCDNNAMEPVVFEHSSVHWWSINERFPDEHILVHAMGFVNRYMTRFRGPGNGRTLIELYQMTIDMSRGEKFDKA